MKQQSNSPESKPNPNNIISNTLKAIVGVAAVGAASAGLVRTSNIYSIEGDSFNGDLPGNTKAIELKDSAGNVVKEGEAYTREGARRACDAAIMQVQPQYPEGQVPRRCIIEEK